MSNIVKPDNSRSCSHCSGVSNVKSDNSRTCNSCGGVIKAERLQMKYPNPKMYGDFQPQWLSPPPDWRVPTPNARPTLFTTPSQQPQANDGSTLFTTPPLKPDGEMS